MVNVPILVMVHSVGSVKKFSMGRSLQTVLVSDGTTKFEIKMWNEAIEKFSHQFEKVTGQWILLSKYTADSFRGRYYISSSSHHVCNFFIFVEKVAWELNSTTPAPSSLLTKMMREFLLKRAN